MPLSYNRYKMRRSSAATSDGQMDHGQVRKPRISRQKLVTWPDTAFGHLTGLPSLGGVGQTLPWADDLAARLGGTSRCRSSRLKTSRRICSLSPTRAAFRQLVDCLAGPRSDGLACNPSVPPPLSTKHPAFPPMPGDRERTLASYELLEQTARGAMGVIYRARHRPLNRTVALKMILAGAHASRADLARFRTEAEAVARLQHPNIVQIYEVGDTGGHPFLSLEFVAGGTLAQK